jgi:hypothetical protein
MAHGNEHEITKERTVEHAHDDHAHHGHDDHGHDDHGHDEHDDHDDDHDSHHEEPLPEPETPLWLTGVGALLFATMGLVFLFMQGDESTEKDKGKDTPVKAALVQKTAIPRRPIVPIPFKPNLGAGRRAPPSGANPGGRPGGGQLLRLPMPAGHPPVPGQRVRPPQ